MHLRSLCNYAPLAALLVLLITGCALNEQMRTPAIPDTTTYLGKHEEELRMKRGVGAYDNIEYYTIKDPTRPGYHYSHTTAYVEFDEQGDFFDRGQLLSALDQAPTGEKRLLIFYVHGWQNNTRSNDVLLFNEFLAHLARSLNEPTAPNKPQPWQVYGVYLSWRGGLYAPNPFVEPRHVAATEAQSDADAFKEGQEDPATAAIGLLRYTTFWSRKAAAARFAGGPLLETIQSISDKVRVNKPGGHLLTRTVLIGHSFGAYIAEKTLLQSLPSEEVMGQDYISPPVDLVILLNSAAPAIYAKEFIDYMKWHSRDSATRPFIVSITSDADWATKDIFPAGTIPETLFDVGSYQGSNSISYQGANEKSFFTTTPGHSPYLLSHDFVPTSDLLTDAFDNSHEQDLWLLKGNLNPNFFHSVSPSFPPLGNYQVAVWGSGGYGKDAKQQAFPQVWTLRPSVPAKDQSPWKKPFNDSIYWVVRVPKQIIADHNDVWNPNTASLIAGVFRMAGLVPAPDPKNPGEYTEESYKLRSLFVHPPADPSDNNLTRCADYPYAELESAGLLH